MKDKIVKTIGGLQCKESECRLLNNEYYKIGNVKIQDSGDIYLINNRYVRVSTSRIVFDHFEKEYKLRNNSLVEGIIGVEGEEVILGWFTRNDLYNVRVVMKDLSERVAIAPNVLNYAFREKKSDAVFYHISLLDANKFGLLRNISREVKESFPYDSKGSIAKVMKNYDTYYKPVICKNAEMIGLTLKDYTFGMEFETVTGIVPNTKLNFLPLIPLRDGSISGIEYATIPLQGPRGVQALIDSVEELSKRTRYGDECSLHLHVGGMPRTVEFILAFYKTISLIQNDLFSMFPLYKKYNFGVKRKNYSAPFPFEEINFRMDPVIAYNDKKALNRNFEHLFLYLSGGHSFEEFGNDLDNVLFHPQDPQGQAKWNIKHRYSFVNLIPLIFGNHQTIEFRIHTPTYDINRIINFLLMNVCIIDYVKSNARSILSNTSNFSRRRPSVVTLLEEYFSVMPERYRKVLFNEVMNYVSERKSATEELTRSKGVVYTEEDVYLHKGLRYHSYRFLTPHERKVEMSFEMPSSGYASFSEEMLRDSLIQLSRSVDIEQRYKSSPPPTLRSKSSTSSRKSRRTGIEPPGEPLHVQFNESPYTIDESSVFSEEAIKPKSDGAMSMGLYDQIRQSEFTTSASSKEPALSFKWKVVDTSAKPESAKEEDPSAFISETTWDAVGIDPDDNPSF